MTRLLLLVLALVVLAPTGTSTAFESPIFESPLPGGGGGRIYAQRCITYLLPTVRVGHIGERG